MPVGPATGFQLSNRRRLHECVALRFGALFCARQTNPDFMHLDDIDIANRLDVSCVSAKRGNVPTKATDRAISATLM